MFLQCSVEHFYFCVSCHVLLRWDLDDGYVCFEFGVDDVCSLFEVVKGGDV